MGPGVSLTFSKSKNSLLKVTVSPARARRMISRDWSVRAPRSLEDTPKPENSSRLKPIPHHIVLEDYIAAVEAAEARRDRLTAQIAAMLPDWTLAPVVAALQTMRSMAMVNAATLIAELGDLSRFADPRQLMAYLGLTPSEYSNGSSGSTGGLL